MNESHRDRPRRAKTSWRTEAIGLERAKWSKWGLLVVLLGMMVAMSGCFGGGSTVIPTGGIIGYVYAPSDDFANSTMGAVILKGLEMQDYDPLPGAVVTSTGTTRTAVTDTHGRFVMQGIPVGEQTLTITHPWYKEEYSSKVVIEEGVAKPLQEKVNISGKGYYLLIGVGQFSERDFWSEYGYPKPDLLESASNDVDIMRNAFYFDNSLMIGELTELTDSQATITSVFTEVRQLVQQMDKNDYLVIYFSGHGVGGDDHRFDALVLHDDFLGDFDLWDYIDGQFKERGLPIADVTLIIDACNSGSFADGDIREITPLPPKAFMKSGFTVISSSRPVENSYVYDEVGQGLFTYYAEIGLAQGRADQDGDGVITARELYDFVAPRVSKHARDFGKTQNVYLWPGNGDPVIFKYID